MTMATAAKQRRARLVCTLGPATATVERIRGLVEAGADIFRVNFSHGTPESHARLLAAVREVEAALGLDLAVLADLPGPKIRLGALLAEPLSIALGQRFVLGPSGRGDGAGAATTHAGLAADLKPGDHVFLSDGIVELVVREERGLDLVTECTRAGSVRAHAGLNAPAEKLSLPSITEADRAGLSEALAAGFDLVAQSFVRSAADVTALRALMGERVVPIVAKIETRPAVRDIDSILAVADAIMVARGDLGVEVPLEEVPLIQKDLVRAARAAGKPVVVATQMLESMTHAARPTRAEASDVANAILDGADAVMLSGETAIGEFPLEAARAAARIAAMAEERGLCAESLRPPAADVAAATVHAAVEAAGDLAGVSAIACFTRSGATARLLAAVRPKAAVYAFAPDATVRRALRLAWGITALPAAVPADTDAMIAGMDRALVERGLGVAGQLVVMVASSPVGKAHTNMIKVHVVGSPVR